MGVENSSMSLIQYRQPLPLDGLVKSYFTKWTVMKQHHTTEADTDSPSNSTVGGFPHNFPVPYNGVPPLPESYKGVPHPPLASWQGPGGGIPF